MATIINPITTVLLDRKEFESGEFDYFPFKYILEDDGVITYYSELSAGRYLRIHEASIKGLGKSKVPTAPKAEIQPLAHGVKIPAIMFNQVKKFFLDVMDMGPGTYEAQIFIVWNNVSEDYSIVVPKQTVSAAAVKYDIGDMLSDDDIVICDIHSHNNMNAFFSGTDDADDRKNPWISGVFGKLSTVMENKFRFNDGCGRHFEMDKEDVFDFDENIATPSEWLDQVVLSSSYSTRTSKVGRWGEAFGLAGDAEKQKSLWDDSVQGGVGGSLESWLDVIDPECDLYDSIVETLNDADNIECKAVIEALSKCIADPKCVPELSERESTMFIEIDYTLRETKDPQLCTKVLDQLSKVY